MLGPSMHVSAKDRAAAEYVVRSHRNIVRDALVSNDFAMRVCCGTAEHVACPLGSDHCTVHRP